MATNLIADVEAVLGDYLRSDGRISALGARVATRLPDNFSSHPWVKVTLLDAQSDHGLEHLVDYLVQLDCYPDADGGSVQGSLLARTVRAALADFTEGGGYNGNVYFTGHLRLPDTNFEPARERYILTATVYLVPDTGGNS